MSITKKLKKQLAHIKLAKEFKSIPVQIYEILLHKFKINTDPKDYYRYQFYKNGRTWDEKSRYVGIDGSMYWPYETNQLKYTATLSDKYIQKTLLKGFGLPTTPILEGIGVNQPINSYERLEEFLKENTNDVVIKPVSSAGGDNILVLTCDDLGYHSNTMNYTCDDIWNHVQQDFTRGCIIEKKMSNVDIIKNIYPLSLNTFRVITIKTKQDSWLIAGIAFKIGARGKTVDNSDSGGILTKLDDNGTIVKVYDCLKQKFISEHPDSKMELIGIRVPGYTEVRELALRASNCFGFLGTIGWDIAYSDDGAIILEGNTLWGCDNIQFLYGGIINDEVARSLKTHYFWQRWDKTRMYPAMGKKRRIRFPWQRPLK